MKSKATTGSTEGENRRVRSSDGRGDHGHRSGIRASGLILSLIVLVGAAERTMGKAAKAAPQNANSLETTSQLLAKPPAQAWHPQIVVHIHNYARVDATELLGAEKISADILRKAGVDTVWLACSAGEGSHAEAACATPLAPSDVNLNLPTPGGSGRFQLVHEVYGFGLGDTAWVFYDVVQNAALKFQLNTPHILGNVIAHEFGHLLLGPNAHTNWGLMCARWSPEQLMAADRGNLGFSDVERAKILGFMDACHRVQLSALAQQAPDAPSAVANSDIPPQLRDSFHRK